MFKHQINTTTNLRLLQFNHAEELFTLTDSCRPYLREWLPWVDGTKTVADTKAFIESTLKQFASNNGFQAGIWYQDKLAGVIGYHAFNSALKSTSIGYWLSKDFQGKGIMTTACEAMVDYAFLELNFNRVEIRCAEQNYKSRAIPERLGFVQEGIIREAEFLCGHYVDHVVYGMLAKDWQKRKGE
ncbi:MAG: GNAT family N-acetyltransferase [Halanaerobiales bacterium]|nr:GNAT family N-acetyltransferase [Halanaerobiales bacterium]